MTAPFPLSIGAPAFAAVTGAMALAAVLLSYLAGSIPFGYVLPRFARGIDVREHGSGNIGATNVGRVLGRRWFFTVLLLDFLKGFLPVLCVRLLVPEAPVAQGGAAWYTLRAPLEVLCGSAAIAGHFWPFALRFRGGKGVATSLGVISILAPLATALAFVVWGVTVAVTRYVSLGSMLAAIAFAAWQVVWIIRSSGGLDAGGISILVFSVVAPAMVLIRHRGNIVRLWQGTEPRIKASQKSGGKGRTGD